MKFTVTPLGGGRSAIAQVVDGIVRYLQPRAASAGRPSSGADGPSRYYADSGEEPGRWSGRAAELAGLRGRVRTDDFAAVLSGRDPGTGERLITAQGSAGRRHDLGVGRHTLTTPEGMHLYDEADAAAALGLTRSEVGRMLYVGAALAVAQLAAPAEDDGVEDRALSRARDRARTMSQVRGSYLVPILADGHRWVTEAELASCDVARSAGTDPDVVRALGDDGDQLPIAEAARLAGVTTRYLRQLACRYEDDGPEIERRLAAGRLPRRAYLVAHRGTKGRWLVTRQELAAFLERRRPPSVRVAYDVTATTEKSLGVLALLGDTAARDAVLGSIEAGNDWAMGWLEEHAAYGRVGGNPVKAEGWMVASFRHLTSRSLDPFPHHHNVVANAVTLSDGSHRGLDARGLYRHAQAASALATAEMRHQLSARLGVRWRPGRRGGWEIAGIDDRVVREFSKRRNEIDDALRELEQEIGRGAHPGEIETIVLRTRPAKSHTPVAELTSEWRARAAALGLDLDALSRLGGRPPQDVEPDAAEVFALLAAPDGVCEGGSVFTRSVAVAALVDLPVPDEDGTPQPLLVGAARLERLIDDFLASEHVVCLVGSGEPLYTTVEALGIQERIADRYELGLHGSGHAVPAPALTAALGGHPHLTNEQRALVRSWCAGGHRFQAAIGRAGAGKTTTVAACADAWAAAGHRVLGAAVKGEAARTLAAATGIECETLAWYLAHDDPDDLPLDSRTVLVIDEASTIGDRDLDAIMTMAARTGASLRLIGDPAQHGAVPAGGMFRVLCERHPPTTPELRTTHRVRHPDDRAAAEALRDGRIGEALDHLEAAGHLHIASDDLAMYRQILGRWWDAHQAGLAHPMVDRRNATRRQLNRLAHHLLRAHGQVAVDEVPASDDRRFSIGDRVTARAPDRSLHVPGDRRAYVRNGALGTITATRHSPTDPGGDTLTVAFDGIGTVDVPRRFFDHHDRDGRVEVGLDHAYALTSYAVQSSTHAVSTSRIDPTATRAETYVDITRGRSANHLYLTAAANQLDEEALPRAPGPSADEAVERRLERSTGELTAYELAHVDDGPAGRPKRPPELHL
ncbi:relaxase domain-containing protein (plasmid) [Iamia sp. SCSIO 61187]|uniref:MobF family relaxase n=1 Tax=Iamia sp. SCSIO 61187 TaxID=2722752 RepID=UPI001C62568B|nr:MobF family relaxase [Iamia sp. SCSIO 61187]QYG95782.1 relaxase domain-containing protein [Iamia sp. SCSIO 61187]